MMPERATIRPLHESNETDWIRLRLALWPDIDLEEQQREMAAICADLDHWAVFVAKCRAGHLCGLEAVASGFSLRYPEDEANLSYQFEVYDTL